MMIGKIEAVREVTFGWAIVRTNQGQERRAMEALERRRFEVYLPMTLRHDVRHNRTYGVPFFPNYLFAKIEPCGPDWWLIHSTMGVHSMVGQKADGTPPPLLRDAVLEKLRERQEGGYIKIGAPPTKPARPDYQKGQRLQIAGGLFDKLEVVFEEFVDEKRAVLLASLVGQSDSRRKLFVEWRDLKALEN